MGRRPHFVYYKGRKYHLNKGYYKTTVALHQAIWEEHFGTIPDGHHIHHKNGDSTDNRIENLECMHKSKHHSLHFSAKKQVEAMHSKKARLKKREWALSQSGQRILSLSGKKAWQNRKAVSRICIICSASFVTKNLNGTKYCSGKCRARCQSLRESISRACVICNANFTTRNYSQASKTCSRKCKGRLISKTKLERLNDFISTVK
jgi:hypothetical protein